MRKRDLLFVVSYISIYIFSILFLAHLCVYRGRISIPLIVTVSVETLFLIGVGIWLAMRRK